mgnify:FL=1
MDKLKLNQDMKIAGNLTISNWNELSKNLNCENDDNWGLAFYFFEERIKTRYINPIKSILEIGDNLGEGFAVVNLQCSLIETIESFINGCNSEYNSRKRKTQWKKGVTIIFNSNKEIFISFFNNRTPFKELNIDGGLFYQDVRCGLLHETQTKNNWKIKCDTAESGLAYQEINNRNIVEKIIHRENFQIYLEKLIARYRISIITRADFDGIPACELRENFIAKFSHICTVSIPKLP